MTTTSNNFLSTDVSNVLGIHQINAPFNGLNFQQAFSTSGFGVQQHGSLFNHQTQFPSNPSVTFPNNQNFQLSSFLTQFLNQQNNNQNLGSFPTSFGIFGTEVSQGNTEQPSGASSTEIMSQGTTEPIVSEHADEATTTTTTTTTTTEDPTLNFDVRREKDENESTGAPEAGSIQTTSRRTIEGLQSSDEDNVEGSILDDKIETKLLLSTVG